MKIPIMKKCCCCLPIRNGLLLLGYIKLISNLLGAFGFSKISVFEDNEILNFSIVAIPLVDGIFTVILIIAAHKESLKLYRIYYYYSAMIVAFYIMLAVMEFLPIAGSPLLICYSPIPFFYILYMYIDGAADIIYIICNLGFQAYLVLIVLSQVKKPQESYEVTTEGNVENNVTSV